MARQVVVLALIFIAIALPVSERVAPPTTSPTSSPSPMTILSPAASLESSTEAGKAPTSSPKTPAAKAPGPCFGTEETEPNGPLATPNAAPKSVASALVVSIAAAAGFTGAVAGIFAF
ncbi:hypothetical protein TIFTF001_011844 [Ficus carica]|uniref:Uncharacterized protein n=1 Tax=Ficus carica TaxID=3494 RepID=A0AA88D5R3_FICCA|nr:hypothetical protein TIFTF001_011844 [Ficus carica]